MVTTAVAILLIAVRLAIHGWNAAALAEVGTRFADGLPTGTEGYDGQFTLFIALDPDPQSVAPRLDSPAYRYQRILLPILGRLLGVGQPDWIPWSLLAVLVVAHALGTMAVTRLVQRQGLPSAYGLIYGLWAGTLAGVGLDLHEPLALALIAAAWLAAESRRPALAAGLLGASLFAKETSVLFWAAAVLAAQLERPRWWSLVWLLVAGAAFAGWQIWLWATFGAPGLASGGAMATPFEWVPFLGFLRIGAVSLPALVLDLVVFGPSILFPALWGIQASVRALWRRTWGAEQWALLLNSAAIAFLPFSTFREPLGLTRFAAGLVTSVVLFASRRGDRKVLNLAFFWCAMLVLLVRQS